MTTFHKETELPVIGFDMGGTSTDVSRYAGSYEHIYESTIAGVTIQAAQVRFIFNHCIWVKVKISCKKCLEASK